jgi:ribosomal protein S18 acetylase RimI-like enzyme
VSNISRADIEVRELRQDELKTAAELMARAMCDNPIFVEVFGPDRERRQKALTDIPVAYAPLLRTRGYCLGAFRDRSLTGACWVTNPGRCKGSLVEGLRILPHLIRACPLDMLIRVRAWRREWNRRDLQEEHFHLGPMGVDVPLQGQGIGSSLFSAVCTRMDKLGGTAYLETDKLVNVRLYERFGFVVVEEATVLGITNWFMKRPVGKTSA